jgi:RsiW-degrading membrane proteinase PrsW (M82 family)
MIYIIRNNQKYGPYDDQTLTSYVNNGQLLLCDSAYDDMTGQTLSVRKYLKSKQIRTKVQHGGSFVGQLKKIGTELLVPKDSFKKQNIVSDTRLLLLALIGLVPSVFMFLPISGFLVFYLVSLYFSVIWGLFFYYFFKTPQVTIKTTVSVFFITQAAVFLIWDLLGIPALNPFYNLTNLGFPLSLLGYVLGVGLSEELGKAIPLFIISSRSKTPLIPQTLVFYGLISGIAFGVFEGVQYQMGINAQQEYTTAYFLNILRLTSLPFIHAVWCGIAGYFISFASLYPKYRIALYFLAIAIPAVLHGVYDTFCGSLLGSIIALPVMFVTVILLNAYLKQSVNYQSKLRN